MQVRILSYFAALAALLVTFLSVFKGGKPTCENYIRNTYLYLVCYVILMIAAMLTMADYNAKKMTDRLLSSVAIFIAFSCLYIGVLIAILYIDRKYVVVKHLLALVYTILSAVLFMTVYYEVGKWMDMVIVLCMTLAVFVTLSLFAFKFKDMISSRVSLSFIILFIVAIVVEGVAYAIAPSSPLTAVINLFVLGLVIYVALKHTKRMIENQQTCEKDGGPDYVREAVSFFISLKNIFSQLLSLKRGKRG